MKKFVFILVLVIAFSCDNTSDAPISQEPEIIAEATIFKISKSEIQGSETDYLNYDISNEVYGYAVFGQIDNVVTLEITITNQVPNSSHAIHIHHGSVRTPERHWNQGSFYAFCNEKSLGKAWAKPFAGDVGNIQTDANGDGFLRIQTDLWALNSGDEKDILDLAIILHEQPQDFIEECDPSHSHAWPHSNPKIAGGTINLMSSVEKNTPSIINQFPEFTKCN